MKNIEQSFFPRIVWNEVKFLSFSNQVGELISRLYITLDVYRKEILIPIYTAGLPKIIKLIFIQRGAWQASRENYYSYRLYFARLAF